MQTALAPAMTAAGNTVAMVRVDPADGGVYYSYFDLGQGAGPWLPLGGHTDAPPAASLYGQDNDQLFVLVKGLDGRLYLNQGVLGGEFFGWQPFG